MPCHRSPGAPLARALAPRGLQRRLALLALLAGALIWSAGCGARSPMTARTTTGGARSPSSAFVASNVLRRDYAGSLACVPCHGEVVAAWRRSPMHQMTRLPDGDTEIRAPFDGREFRFKGDVARFERVNGARFMHLASTADGTKRSYRITKVIGGRYREDFAGVEVASSDPVRSGPIGDPHAELILPVSYVFQNQSFRLKGYSVMVGERPGLRAGGVWNRTCIFCHNTVPYFDDLWGVLHGAGAPGYQGEVVDRVMPVARRMRYLVTDEDALLQALDEERLLLRGGARATTGSGSGTEPRLSLRAAIAEASASFGPEHFIEIGIGCESCHGGSREHVDFPHHLPTFEPRAPFLSVQPAATASAATPVTRAEWQNRACARCHQVLFSRYPWTWEGGTRRAAGQAGGSHITSGEGRDFLLGGCAQAMACTACHDPHGEDRRESLSRLGTPAGNHVCTSCHGSFASPAALKAHSHHDPEGAGGSCVGCHMPRKNMGLGYALTRYHRIGSPTDVARVERDRPMECALCHADKTIGALLADITRWWGKRYDVDAVTRLYGSMGANALVATIERGHAHEQAAAMGAAGEQRFVPATAAITRQAAVNSYPLVRYHAAAALAAIRGQPVPSDLGSSSPDEQAAHGSSASAPDSDED